jgi:hypothetical protein
LARLAARTSTQDRWSIRLGRKLRNELLDLSDRLVFSLHENLLMIFRGQMGLQTMDRTEVNLTTRDHVEDDGKTPSSACCADALTGRRLGHVVADHEKLEQRGMPEFGPQTPSIDGVDVAEQAGGAFMVLPNEVTELVKQRAVVELRNIEDHRRPLVLWDKQLHARSRIPTPRHITDNEVIGLGSESHERLPRCEDLIDLRIERPKKGGFIGIPLWLIINPEDPGALEDTSNQVDPP